jgi:hypothetical protein
MYVFLAVISCRVICSFHFRVVSYRVQSENVKEEEGKFLATLRDILDDDEQERGS